MGRQHPPRRVAQHDREEEHVPREDQGKRGPARWRDPACSGRHEPLCERQGEGAIDDASSPPRGNRRRAGERTAPSSEQRGGRIGIAPEVEHAGHSSFEVGWRAKPRGEHAGHRVIDESRDTARASQLRQQAIGLPGAPQGAFDDPQPPCRGGLVACRPPQPREKVVRVGRRCFAPSRPRSGVCREAGAEQCPRVDVGHRRARVDVGSATCFVPSEPHADDGGAHDRPVARREDPAGGRRSPEPKSEHGPRRRLSGPGGQRGEPPTQAVREEPREVCRRRRPLQSFAGPGGAGLRRHRLGLPPRAVVAREGRCSQRPERHQRVFPIVADHSPPRDESVRGGAPEHPAGATCSDAFSRQPEGITDQLPEQAPCKPVGGEVGNHGLANGRCGRQATR